MRAVEAGAVLENPSASLSGVDLVLCLLPSAANQARELVGAMKAPQDRARSCPAPFYGAESETHGVGASLAVVHGGTRGGYRASLARAAGRGPSAVTGVAV